MVLVPFSVGLGALSLALAIAAKEQAWIFWTGQQAAIFPLDILAAGFGGSLLAGALGLWVGVRAMDRAS